MGVQKGYEIYAGNKHPLTNDIDDCLVKVAVKSAVVVKCSVDDDCWWMVGGGWWPINRFGTWFKWYTGITRLNTHVFKNIIITNKGIMGGEQQRGGIRGTREDADGMCFRISAAIKSLSLPLLTYYNPLNLAYYICSGVWYEFKRLSRRLSNAQAGTQTHCLQRHVKWEFSWFLAASFTRWRDCKRIWVAASSDVGGGIKLQAWVGNSDRQIHFHRQSSNSPLLPVLWLLCKSKRMIAQLRNQCVDYIEHVLAWAVISCAVFVFIRRGCVYMCIIPTLHAPNPYIKQTYSRGKSPSSSLAMYVVCSNSLVDVYLPVVATAELSISFRPSVHRGSSGGRICNLWRKGTESVFVYKTWILKNSSSATISFLPHSLWLVLCRQ